MREIAGYCVSRISLTFGEEINVRDEEKEVSELLNKTVSAIQEIQMDHLEMMAAAFLLKTNIPIMEVVLVQEIVAGKVLHYFKRKDEL